jgi:hypothetical protein
MPVKKATKTPGVDASLHEGQMSIYFNCVETEVCRFALCHSMPPDGSEECFFRDCGSCRRTLAQQTTLEILINKLKKELKQLEEDSEG